MQELTGVRLADLTTLRLGGPARSVHVATTTDELVDAVRDVDDRGEPLLVVGGGSNLVVGDEGVDAAVVLVRARGVRLCFWIASSSVMPMRGVTNR